MAFARPTLPPPAQIGRVFILLHDLNGQAGSRQAHFKVELLDEHGNFIETVQGDLVPHLTPAQITSVLTFLDQMRAKAVAELLPAP